MQAIIGLHDSDMTDEEKAAASKLYYKKGKATRKSPVRLLHKTREVSEEPGAGAGAAGNARGRSNAEAASTQGRTGPSQPWSAQSPTGVQATGQVSRQGNAVQRSPLQSAVNRVILLRRQKLLFASWCCTVSQLIRVVSMGIVI